MAWLVGHGWDLGPKVTHRSPHSKTALHPWKRLLSNPVMRCLDFVGGFGVMGAGLIRSLFTCPPFAGAAHFPSGWRPRTTHSTRPNGNSDATCFSTPAERGRRCELRQSTALPSPRDTVAISAGANGTLGSRNAPALVNMAWQPRFHREGGVPSLKPKSSPHCKNPPSCIATWPNWWTNLPWTPLPILGIRVRSAVRRLRLDPSLAAFQRTLIGAIRPTTVGSL